MFWTSVHSDVSQLKLPLIKKKQLLTSDLLAEVKVCSKKKLMGRSMQDLWHQDTPEANMPNAEVVMIGLFIAPASERCRFSVRRICRRLKALVAAAVYSCVAKTKIPRQFHVTSWYLWNIFETWTLYVSWSEGCQNGERSSFGWEEYRLKEVGTIIQIPAAVWGWWPSGTMIQQVEFMIWYKLMLEPQTYGPCWNPDFEPYPEFHNIKRCFQRHESTWTAPSLTTGTSARRPSLAWSLRRAAGGRFPDSAVTWRVSLRFPALHCNARFGPEPSAASWCSCCML